VMCNVDEGNAGEGVSRSPAHQGRIPTERLRAMFRAHVPSGRAVVLMNREIELQLRAMGEGC